MHGGVLIFFAVFAVLSVTGEFLLQFQLHRYRAINLCCGLHYYQNNIYVLCRECNTQFRMSLCFGYGSTSHQQNVSCIPNINIGGNTIEFGGTIGYINDRLYIANPFTYISPTPISRHGYQLYFIVQNPNGFFDKIIVDIPNSTTSVMSQTVTGIYNRATLVLSYSLSCKQHYYGSDCSVNCIPHNDDTNGHYTCNSITGAIICRDGWQNSSSNCTEVDCHLICDSIGGQCINGSCVCNTGWSGDECDKPQCAIGCNPQGGYCTVPNECLCNQNWNGTNCSEPLCAVNCSSIGGICPTADNCTCLQGYTGDSCEIDLYPCDHQMPCLNEANCSHTDDIGGYNCSCSIGYTGENCETDIDECSMEPCLNNGTCLNDVPGSYICICDIGWTGEICEYVIDYCDSNPCMNNGSCHNLTNGHYCHCPIQYEGLNCELTVDVCVPNPCQNNATCTHHYTNYTCTCTEDYTGNNCESPIPNVTQTSTVQMTSAVTFAISGGIAGLGAIAVITVSVILIIVVLINSKKHKRNDNNLLPAYTSTAVCNPNYNGCNIDNGHRKFPCDYEIPVLHNTSCELPHVYETIGMGTSPQPVYSRLNREEHQLVDTVSLDDCDSNVYNQLKLISSGDYERCSNIEYDGQ